MSATTALGTHLRVLRKQRGRTIKQVAKEVKAAESTVQSWELGYRDIPASRLLAYCSAIGAHIRIALEDQ